MTDLKPSFKPFTLGSIVATPWTLEALSNSRILECLIRHARGDWGQVCEEDAAENDLATCEGFRILSAYAIDPAQPCAGFGDNCVCVITEADRSVTALLLPSEY